jgi:L-threonylcarbamoyladenylate synthase
MQAEIDKTVNVLCRGGTILYPTDTIWGIGCDATNEKAVDKIYKIKQRVVGKSLLILVDDPERIYDYVTDVNPLVFELVKNYNRPLTVIYPRAKNLAKGVVADDNTVGIRVVDDEFCRQVIKTFGKAIVSTSANISGESPPLRFQQISEKVKKSVDYVVNIYQNEIRTMKPSRIIKVNEKGDFEIIRN